MQKQSDALNVEFTDVVIQRHFIAKISHVNVSVQPPALCYERAKPSPTADKFYSSV
jgi:hypothetical protein